MKTLFIGIDMQNDFMDEHGALYVQGSEEIKSNIKTLTAKIMDMHIPALYTMDMHQSDDAELSDNPDYVVTFPKHCLEDSEGSWLIPQATGVDEYCDEDDIMPDHIQLYYKNKFSVFEGNEDFLATLNAYASIDNIYVFGVAGDVCVKAAIDGMLQYKDKQFTFENLYIIEDCIASLNDEQFEIYCNALANEHDFIKIIKSTELFID